MIYIDAIASRWAACPAALQVQSDFVQRHGPRQLNLRMRMLRPRPTTGRRDVRSALRARARVHALRACMGVAHCSRICMWIMRTSCSHKFAVRCAAIGMPAQVPRWLPIATACRRHMDLIIDRRLDIVMYGIHVCACMRTTNTSSGTRTRRVPPRHRRAIMMAARGVRVFGARIGRRGQRVRLNSARARACGSRQRHVAIRDVEMET